MRSAKDGFTPENLDAFQQYQKEQVYAYGLLSFHNIVVADAGITKSSGWQRSDSPGPASTPPNSRSNGASIAWLAPCVARPNAALLERYK